MDSTIDHVTLNVSDLEASQSWYREHLDYTERDRQSFDGHTSVFMAPSSADDAEAHLELRETPDGDVEVGDAWGHIAVRVEDLYEAYEGLMDAGVPDYRDPDSCGGNYAFVKDPDGHEVEIVPRDFGSPWSIDHVMMRVEDADRAIGFWTRKFEYEHVGRWEADTFANFFMRPPEAPRESLAVELTYNYDGRTYTIGNAWDHVGIGVDNLDDAWSRMTIREAPIISEPVEESPAYGFISDPEGHKVELFET